MAMENKTKIIIETESGNSEQKLKNVAKGLQTVGNEAKTASGKVKASSAIMQDSFIKAAAKLTALGTAAKTAFSMAKEAAQFQEVSLYTKTAAENIGLSFDRLVAASKRGANGMASNLTIMKANLKALKGGLKASEDDFEQLWKIADATSDELGQSIEQTFEQITTAITTGNQKSLVSMGLLPESFKKASNGADLLQSRSETLKAVLTQLGPKAAELAKHGDTAADKFKQLDTAVENLKIDIGEQLTPAVTDLVSGLKDVVKYASDAAAAMKWVISGFDLGDEDANNRYLSSLGIEGKKEYYRKLIKDRKERIALLTDGIGYFTEKTGDAGDMMNERRGLVTELRHYESALEKLNKMTKQQVIDANSVADKTEKTTKETEETASNVEKSNKSADSLLKKYDDLATKILPKMPETTSELLDVNMRLLEAASGISTYWGNTSKGIKAAVTEAEKLSKELEDGFFDMSLEGQFRSKSYTDQVKSVMAAGLPTGIANLNMFGNLVGNRPEVKDDAKDAWGAIKSQVAETFTNVIITGIEGSNIGDILTSAVSSIASEKASSYGGTIFSRLLSGKGLSGFGGAVSGFVGSLAISYVANNWKKWTGDKNKGETFASLGNTQERGAQAYLNSFLAQLNPYASDSDLFALADARNANIYTSWKEKNRKSHWLTGAKSYSDTTPQSTFDAIAAIENLTDAIKESSNQKERELDLLNSQGYSYQVAGEQLNALKIAMDRAASMSNMYSAYWREDGKTSYLGGYAGADGTYKIDLTDSIQDLKKAYYEALREYGTETAQRNAAAASSFMGLFPYISDMSAASALGYVTNASNSFADRNANADLFGLISNSAQSQFELSVLQSESPVEYATKYLEVLEKSRDAAELVMEQQKQIYFDATKTFEEQSAALEVYQSAQEQYYNSKLEILAQERAKEEQIKREQQQANLRASEKMEALLGFSGELSRTNNKIYILEGADQQGALKELLGAVKDDPEAVAAVQAMLTAANNKNKFGKF